MTENLFFESSLNQTDPSILDAVKNEGQSKAIFNGVKNAKFNINWCSSNRLIWFRWDLNQI